MLPHARTCASRKLKSLPIPRSSRQAPPEPLLFLYPRWFQKAHLSSQAYSHTANSTLTSPTSLADPDAPASTSDILGGRSKASITKPRLQPSRIQNVRKTKGNKTLGAKNVTPGNENVTGGRNVAALENGHPTTSVMQVSTFRPNAVKIDGLRLARKLASISSVDSPIPTANLQVPADFLEWLVGSSEQNMWAQDSNSTCIISVLSPVQDDQKHRDIILSGPHHAHEAAVAYLTRLQEHFEKGKSVSGIKGQDNLSIKGVIAIPPPFTQTVRIDAIPVPGNWTVRTFYDYVKAITQASAPKAIERAWYRDSNGFDQAGIRTILTVFSAPELQSYHSTAALRLVLSRFRRRTHLSSDIGQIWNFVTQQGLVPDITCFNLELERSFLTQNNERISFLLHMMQNLGVKPNVATWALLFQVLDGSGQRRKIINALLRTKKLESPEDQDIVVRALVRADFQAVVTQEDGISQFAEWLQRRFGESWLSPGAVSDMVSQCVKSQASWKVHEVLDIARYFSISLDEVDSIPLLDVIRRTRHFGDTLAFFKNVFARDNCEMAQSQLELLFKTAWSQRLFNTCRLIWRFCASHGMINYAMRRLVASNLAMNHLSKTDDGFQGRNLRSWLAATTIGTCTAIEGFEQRFPLLGKQGWSESPAEVLCRWCPNDGTRHEQLQLAHLLLEQDLSASTAFWPMRNESFLKQLSSVHIRDCQWHRAGVLKTISTSDLFSQIVKVGLHRKPKDKAGRSEKEIPNPTVIQTSSFVLPSQGTELNGAAIERHKVRQGVVLDVEELPIADARLGPVEAASSSPTVLRSSAVALTMVSTSPNLLDNLYHHLQCGWRRDRSN